MKIKKLDMRGVAHDVVLVAFLVIFALGGVAYMVASHADSCTAASVSGSVSGVSDPVSDVASGAVSEADCPVSGAVSDIVSEASTDVQTGGHGGGDPNQGLGGLCKITDVPVTAKIGEEIHPSVTFSNTGSKIFAPSADGMIFTTGDTAVPTGGHGGPATATDLSPGTSIAVDTGLRFSPVYSSSTLRSVTFTVTNKLPEFSCTATALMPVKPASVSTGSTSKSSASSSTTTQKATSPQTASKTAVAPTNQTVTSSQNSNLSSQPTEVSSSTSPKASVVTQVRTNSEQKSSKTICKIPILKWLFGGSCR